MKIGFLDVDGHNFPNLALMKLSSYHKQQGDIVDWYTGIEMYDRVYMSKVFTFSEDEKRVIQAREVIKGGTGYKLYDQVLSESIEHISPDYSLYPKFTAAYGFLTRGCINHCEFCVVPRKEGNIQPHADIEEFLGNKKTAILMDNNVLASSWGIKQIEKITFLKIKIDFNQGLDCRIIAEDKQIAKLLSKVKWIRYVRMAYDNSNLKNTVEKAVMNLVDAGIPAYKLWFYLLVRENEIEDAENRVREINLLGCTPFAMPYRKLDTNQEPSPEQKAFARWVNTKQVFKSCTYQEYKFRT